MSRHILHDWRPEDPAFWAASGHRIARRNLWISIPNLLLAFSIWMLWSTAATRLNTVGFNFSSGQLCGRTALTAVSGETLRIFYSFMVPLFGGRVWPTLSALSLDSP